MTSTVTAPPPTTSQETGIMPHFNESGPKPLSVEEIEKEKERTQRIRVKNRRKLYLDRHPSYFTSSDLELSDPLLYDRCIRRFQTPAEREADGKKKGYSGVLEADLYRSEAKIAALHSSSSNVPLPFESPSDPSASTHAPSSSFSAPSVNYVRGENGDVVPEEPDEVPATKEEGFERWKTEMTLKFLRGEDQDFEYEAVDESEEWDSIERRESEERWFEEEEPEWVGEGDAVKRGETGVQDF